MLCHCFQYRRRKSEIKERTGRIIKFTLNVQEAKAIYVESTLVEKMFMSSGLYERLTIARR